MVEVDLILDRFNSEINCYHILCSPTELSRRYNPRVYANLSVTSQERDDYCVFLFDGKLKPDQLRVNLATPAKDLDSFCSLVGLYVPPEISANFAEFQARFGGYFEGVKRQFEPLMQERLGKTKELIERIYQLSKVETGVSVPIPERLEMRVVEGMSPSSYGRTFNEVFYVFEQMRNYLDEVGFFSTLVHECVGHQTASCGRRFHQEFFGGYMYNFEEGFVKVLTRRIIESLFGKSQGGPSGPDQELAFKVFEESWPDLKKLGFLEWYKRGLIRIRDS